MITWQRLLVSDIFKSSEVDVKVVCSIFEHTTNNDAMTDEKQYAKNTYCKFLYEGDS